MRHIVVKRAESAWALQTGSETRYFRSGAQAERSARDLAEVMAARGEPTEVAVYDLAGRPVGRVTFPATA